jgi:hypothetical protein
MWGGLIEFPSFFLPTWQFFSQILMKKQYVMNYRFLENEYINLLKTHAHAYLPILNENENIH